MFRLRAAALVLLAVACRPRSGAEQIPEAALVAIDTASLMASVAFLMLFGLVLQAILARVEVAVAPWRRQAA